MYLELLLTSFQSILSAWPSGNPLFFQSFQCLNFCEPITKGVFLKWCTVKQCWYTWQKKMLDYKSLARFSFLEVFLYFSMFAHFCLPSASCLMKWLPSRPCHMRKYATGWRHPVWHYGQPQIWSWTPLCPHWIISRKFWDLLTVIVHLSFCTLWQFCFSVLEQIG